MAYTVLARRYRSAAFDQVVGQEPIARTLQNAIASGRVAHAYLFTGTRGVGKTSMARIFARALNAPDTIPNCPKPPGEHDYPERDVQDRMATAIMRGDDLNVIEIDGASNNSVENARQLIANAGLAPTGNARFKIYIIDEVHMLSTAAFNALLKTMEEPPAHVKFILCTTESHKVPATIQSRCQRFDFRNIPTKDIASHLRNVLTQEKVKGDDEVVWQLARLGNGSMRDALSLLDRLISAGEQPLTAQTLVQMLGLPPQQRISDLIDAMADGDVKAALEATAGLLDQGIAQDQLMEVLVERLRQLMLIRACGPDSELVEIADDARAAAGAQAARFDVQGLVYMISVCENLLRTAKASSNPRALLDATVVRLALAEKLADIAGLLAGNPAPASASGPASGGGPGASSRPAPSAPVYGEKKK
ncbi:MAG: DNA polymerase III subunit gamma/tau [Planctomycetota bacterium]|nr:DNA polymerase III subunit gamma/tau [Planctomycetota bacterium]